jgi:hypothetical protein
MTRTARIALAALALCGGIVIDMRGAISQTGNPDWPCVQVLQPELSVGAMWTGPDPAQAASTWRDTPAVAELVRRVAPRRLPVDQANAEISRFLAAAEGDRRTVATRIFAGLFETLDAERGAIIRGIQRYSSRQATLAERIEKVRRELDSLDRRSGDARVLERRAELEAQLTWDSRIFDDRERLLPAVCEQPVAIERRLFALSRALAEELDKTRGN